MRYIIDIKINLLVPSLSSEFLVLQSKSLSKFQVKTQESKGKTALLWARVFQPQSCWHLRLDGSSLWERPGASCSLQQQPWPPPRRCRSILPPSCDNQKCPQTHCQMVPRSPAPHPSWELFSLSAAGFWLLLKGHHSGEWTVHSVSFYDSHSCS